MKKIFALTGIVVLFAFSAGGALAGEITGNGKYKGANGNSPCSFSGQEDRQWYTDDLETARLDPADVVKGVPQHSQNWGQVLKYEIPGNGNPTGGGAGPAGCNPHVGGGDA